MFQHGRRDQGSSRGESSHKNSDRGDTKNDRPKKESIIDLTKYLDQEVHVKFQGGREVSGKLKGFDQTLNLVVDNAVEYLRDPEDSYKITENSRKLGLIVCRGMAVTVVSPQGGYESIPNPFENIE